MKIWTLALALLAAVALAACGGDGGDSTETTEAASDDYIAQAEAVCEDTAADLAEVNLELGIDIKPEETIATLERVVVARQEGLEATQAIEVPEDAAAEWEEYVAAYEDYAQATEDQLAAFESGEQKQIDAAGAAAAEAGDARKTAAEKVGLSSCAAVLPDDDKAAAEEVVRSFATSNDPATSCEYENPDAYVLETAVEDGFGGMEKCIAQQEQIEGNLPSDIKVSETTGIDDVVATVNFMDVGGKFDGKPSTATLYKVDGEWRIWSIALAQ